VAIKKAVSGHVLWARQVKTSVVLKGILGNQRKREKKSGRNRKCICRGGERAQKGVIDLVKITQKIGEQ